MRGARFLVLLFVAAAAFGCARSPAPSVIAAQPADLDSLMYANGPGVVRAGVVVGPAVVAAPVVAVANGPIPEPDVGPGYTLDSGDKLRIVIFGQDGLTNSYVVDASGNITMPLIGLVSARGLATNELARAIADRLRRGFVREPHVAIEVDAYRPFFILGEVTAPGQYPYVPNMTVETAVAIAGGYTPRGYRGDVKISRNWQGQLYRRAVPPTYPVKPGDTITVDERWF